MKFIPHNHTVKHLEAYLVMEDKEQAVLSEQLVASASSTLNMIHFQQLYRQKNQFTHTASSPKTTADTQTHENKHKKRHQSTETGLNDQTVTFLQNKLHTHPCMIQLLKNRCKMLNASTHCPAWLICPMFETSTSWSEASTLGWVVPRSCSLPCQGCRSMVSNKPNRDNFSDLSETLFTTPFSAKTAKPQKFTWAIQTD